jgi:hypothetical protein
MILQQIHKAISFAKEHSTGQPLLLLTTETERALFLIENGISKASSVEEEFPDTKVIVTDEIETLYKVYTEVSDIRNLEHSTLRDGQIHLTQTHLKEMDRRMKEQFGDKDKDRFRNILK